MSKTSVNLKDAEEAALRNLLDFPVTKLERTRIRHLLGEDVNATEQGSAELDDRFKTEGVYAAMDVDVGRGRGFALNQDQGYWAEQLLRTLPGEVQFVYFGLSDPVDPRSPQYAPTRRKHRYILVIEGKRPDLLAFPRAVVAACPHILDWAERPLNASDFELLRAHALGGVEIKSSKQHYGVRQRMRANDGRFGNLSFTVKDEEFDDLNRWQSNNPHPRVVLMQVFVDQIHWMPYSVFLEERQAKRTKGTTDPETGKPTQFLAMRDGIGAHFADIAVSDPNFQFKTMGSKVTPPGIWPAATLHNVSMPNFSSVP